MSNADNSLFHQLIACYSEPHRKYHTMQHLNECFAHLETLRLAAERPAEVELAVWFHDAIYETRRKNNEEKSADWACDSALASGLSTGSAARIYDLVMVTKHNAVVFGRDAEVLVDIDLGILGTEALRFDEYENQIREEYSWVPWPLYRRERRRVLHEFKACRPSIAQSTFARHTSLKPVTTSLVHWLDYRYNQGLRLLRTGAKTAPLLDSQQRSEWWRRADRGSFRMFARSGVTKRAPRMAAASAWRFYGNQFVNTGSWL